MISPTPIIIWYFFAINNSLLYLNFMLKMTLINNYFQYIEIYTIGTMFFKTEFTWSSSN